MRAILIVLAVALSAGCSSPPPAQCDAALCAGCCTSAGQCVAGTATDACGANGAACDVCVGSQACNAGKCGAATGGGAGGGGAAGGGVGGGGVGGGGVGGGGSGGGVASTGTFPDIAGGSNGRQPMLIIDAAGTRHLLYEQVLGQGASTIPFRYGECTANCGTAAGWKFASVGDRGIMGSYGKLALTAQGKPRIVWARSASVSDPYVLHFGSCDTDCTNAANWTTGPFKTFGSSEYIYQNSGRNLAIDSAGRAHFIYSMNALFYVSCAGNCTQESSWSAPVKLSDNPGRVSLATSGTGLKVAYTTRFEQVLGYRTCDSACDQGTSWSAQTTVYPSAEGHVSLRLDGQGRPRVLFNVNGGGSPQSSLSLYTWCDANCGVPASWTTVTIGLADGDGKLGLDFAFHSDGAVSAAYESSDSKLSMVRCPASCQSLSGVWSRAVLEDSDTVKAEVSPPLPMVCSSLNPPKQGYAYWYPGEETSAAVHPVTGKLEVAHRTYTLEKCGFGGNVTEGVTITRYSGPF